MREIGPVRQPQGGGRRRWFTDTSMDLTVWQNADGDLVAFQLAYDRSGDERCLTWRAGRGFTHDAVDDGELAPGRHKRSPLLVPDGRVPWQRLSLELERRGGALDPSVVAAVQAALRRA